MSVFTVLQHRSGIRKFGALSRRGMSPQHATGAFKYEPGAGRTGVRLAQGAPPSDIISLEKYVPVIYDQGSTGSCLAQAGCGAAETLENAQGLPAQLRSRRALYYMLRAKDGLERQDEGGYLDSMLWVWAKYGVPTEERFAWSQLRINQAPSAPVIFSGDQYRGMRYEYITGSGNQRHLLVDAALGEGLPVLATAQVGASFSAFRGSGTLDSVDARPYGGHAFYICASAKDGRLPLKRIVNSWSEDWGDGGKAWIGPNFFSSIDSLVVVHGWKRSAAQRQQLLPR